MTSTELSQEIFNRYGAVVRCRGHFVYTKKGERLTDLYRENGRAILGWRTTAFTKLKDVLGKGVTGTFISEQGTSHQLDKAVSALFEKPCHGVFVNFDCSALDFSNLKNLTPPLPWASDIFISIYEDCSSLTIEEQAFLSSYKITVPSPLSAALIRSIYDYKVFLETSQEKQFFIYDTVLTKFFTRKGMLLFPKITDPSLYDQFVLFCLDNGVIINPDINSPSLIPFGTDKGVFNKLKNANGEKFL